MVALSTIRPLTLATLVAAAAHAADKPEAPSRMLQPITLAASWDPTMVRDVHAAIGRALRAKGVDIYAGPTLDLARDARRAHVSETFGEDPYLAGEMGVAAIEGLSAAGVRPTVRSFGSSPAPVAERELRETYFPPFEEALRRTKADTIVLARNAIDGVPAHANRWLVNDVLRGEWKFHGKVLADRGGVAELRTLYGSTSEALVDGEIPAPAAMPQIDALAAAKRCIVLLANDGVLPITGRAMPTIAILGAEPAIVEQLRSLLTGIAAVTAAAPADVIVLAGDAPPVALAPPPAKALIAAWGLGDFTAKAVASVLLGETNAGGKLPITLARKAGQLPLFYDAKPSARRGYLFDTSDPLYPFGWGLAYTTFEIGPPRLARASVAAGSGVEVSVDVRNTGRLAGDETVQVYVHQKLGSLTRPVKRLKAFQRVTLAAGESRTLTFSLPPRAFEMWDAGMRRVIEPGEFEILAGGDSSRLQSASLTITGGAR